MEEGNRRAAALHEEIPLLSFHSMGTSLYDDRGDLFIHRTWRPERDPSLLYAVAVPAPPPAAGATAAMGNGCWGPGPGPLPACLWALTPLGPCQGERERRNSRWFGWWAMGFAFALARAGAPQQTGLSRPPFPRTRGDDTSLSPSDHRPRGLDRPRAAAAAAAPAGFPVCKGVHRTTAFEFERLFPPRQGSNAHTKL